MTFLRAQTHHRSRLLHTPYASVNNPGEVPVKLQHCLSAEESDSPATQGGRGLTRVRLLNLATESSSPAGRAGKGRREARRAPRNRHIDLLIVLSWPSNCTGK